MTPDATQDPGRGAPLPALVILTGASHTGKTSVAREILGMVPPPAAFLSVDRTLKDVLVRPEGDPWAQIPLTYELLIPQVEELLNRGWLVVFESTFTFVPESGSPEFHREALSRLVSTCASLGAELLVVQLRADEEVTRARASATNRLPAGVVAQTADLHRAATMPGGTLRLDTIKTPPSELARAIVEELGR